MKDPEFIKTAHDAPQLAEGRNAQMSLDNTFERCHPACWGELHSFILFKQLKVKIDWDIVLNSSKQGATFMPILCV